MLLTFIFSIILVGLSMLLMYFGRSKINPNGCNKCGPDEKDDKEETPKDEEL